MARVLVAAGRLPAGRRFYGASRKFHPHLHSQDLHSRRHAATTVEIFLENLSFWVTIRQHPPADSSLQPANLLSEKAGEGAYLSRYQRRCAGYLANWDSTDFASFVFLARFPVRKHLPAFRPARACMQMVLSQTWQSPLVVSSSSRLLISSCTSLSYPRVHSSKPAKLKA